MIGRGPHSPPSRQAFRYDFPTDTWTQLPNMPRGRARHQSVVVDGKLYLVGGDVEASNEASLETTSPFSIDCCDLQKGTWIEPPTVPLIDTSSNTKVAARGGKLILFEGLKEGRSGKLCVHAFDGKDGRWVHSDIAYQEYAAHMLQIDMITEYCENVIRSNLHTSNCIGVMRLGNLYGLSNLESGKTDGYRYVHHVKVYDVNEKTITEVKKVPSIDDVNEVSSTANDNDSLSSSDDENHDLDECDFWITDDDSDEDDDNEDDNTDDNDNKEDDNNEDEDNKDDDNKDDGNKDENNEDDDNKDDDDRDDKDEDNKDDDNKEDDNKDDGNKDDDNEDDDNKDDDNKDDDNKDDDNDNLEDLDRPSDRHEDGGVFHRFHTNFQIFDWRFEDDIINHKFKDKESGERERSTSLFGQSVLIITKKISIGWYCRDLEEQKLENSDEPNQTA
ncbi:KLHL31 [Branchiostoma lanceolatum]|uniref:KLHL31 protein n=1 Tax=Branchiostoma lanceolatum TaxID=7740 RepID=A0A8K0AED7_BRALA|nr:KLHL31 [Branchiostoma lanceolatum]